MKENHPYGSWPSQLTSEQLASGAVRLSEARAFNGEVLWLEGRPAEAGRTALVKFDGVRCETLGPDDLNVRTLVHEYGGGGWLPTQSGIWVTSFEDQRLWLLNDDFHPITAEPSVLRGHRFANGVEVPDSTETIWVTERHQGEGGQPHNMLVTVTETGEVTEIASGADFYSSPVVSPDGLNSPICLGITLRCRGITSVYT